MTAPVQSASLRSHLQSILPELRRSSCLLISSGPPIPDLTSKPAKQNHVLKAYHNRVEDYVKRANFVLAMELGLRTVQSTVTSAYPTYGDLDSTLELARRSGATTVLGIGSGAAMDLAKVVSRRMECDRLVLAPATMGGTMAAASGIDLMLADQEEMLLLPRHRCDEKGGMMELGNGPTTTVVLETEAMAVPHQYAFLGEEGIAGMGTATVADAALASLSVAVDAASALDGEGVSVSDGNAVTPLLDEAVSSSLNAIRYARQDQWKEAQKWSVMSVYHAGGLLSFGLADAGPLSRRSVPVALASALLPRYFPRGHVLSVWASLLPGLCSVLLTGARGSAMERVAKVPFEEDAGKMGTAPTLAEWAEHITKDAGVLPLTAFVEGTPDVSALMKMVDANQALVNSVDVKDVVLEQVLMWSLNR